MNKILLGYLLLLGSISLPLTAHGITTQLYPFDNGLPKLTSPEHPLYSDDDYHDVIIVDYAADGDLNGDGADDIVMVNDVWDYDAAAWGIGAYINFGGEEIVQQKNIRHSDVTITGSDFCAHLCYTGYLGDLNQDGYDDFYITDATSLGTVFSVYIYYGQATWSETLELDSAAAVILTAADLEADGGLYINAIGDVNGDAIDDVIITVCYSSTTIQETVGYIFFGEAGVEPLVGDTNLEAEADVTISGSSNGGIVPNFPSKVGSGDVSGDGINDLLFDAYDDESGTPANYRKALFYGPLIAGSDISLDEADALFFGESRSEITILLSQLEIGDYNGDHIDDLAILMYDDLRIIKGSTTPWSGEVTLSEDAFDRIIRNDVGGVNTSLSTTDINNDGMMDLVASREHFTEPLPTRHHETTTHVTSIFSGAVDLPDGAIALQYVGTAGAPKFGDVNGDNLIDVLFLNNSTTRDSLVLAYSTDHDADGFTAALGDCRDRNNQVKPGQPETTPNLIDNDCDGPIDEDYNYRYKKNGALKTVRYLSDTVVELRYKNDQRQQTARTYFPKTTRGTRWSLIPNSSQHVVIDDWFENLCVYNSYSMREVTCKRVELGFTGLYYGTIKVIVNPLTGKNIVVVAKNDVLYDETKVTAYTVSANNKFREKNTIRLSQKANQKYELVDVKDGFNLLINHKTVGKFSFTATNKIQLQKN